MTGVQTCALPISGDGGYVSARRKNSTVAGGRTSPVTKGRILTQHTGLPPRDTGAAAGPGALRPGVKRKTR